MNREEAIVQEYLQAQEFHSIVHEPDGNVPPDFLVNDEIAVEVRRLNQHCDRDANQPLESLEYRLIPRIAALLKDYQTVEHEHSAFVTIHFRRPINDLSITMVKVKGILRSHLDCIRERRVYPVCENLALWFEPWPERLDGVYELGSTLDMDQGGWVIPNIYDNLKIALCEKDRKVAPYRPKYNTWWLVLVDYIGYGIREQDVRQLTARPKIEHSWGKILLVAPMNPSHAVEVRWD